MTRVHAGAAKSTNTVAGITNDLESYEGNSTLFLDE